MSATFTPLAVWCARAAHEMNNLYREAIGEPSSGPWRTMPLVQRRAAIVVASDVLDGASAETVHEHWQRLLEADGWTLGPVRDTTRKTHPNLVPFARLSPAQQRKDELYISTIRAMAAALQGQGLTLDLADFEDSNQENHAP